MSEVELIRVLCKVLAVLWLIEVLDITPACRCLISYLFCKACFPLKMREDVFNLLCKMTLMLSNAL